MLHPSLCICGRNPFARSCGGTAHWSQKYHEESVDWSQGSCGLSDRISCTVEDVCVKPSLALRASVMFAKQAFWGKKNKAHNFTFKLGSFAL